MTVTVREYGNTIGEFSIANGEYMTIGPVNGTADINVEAQVDGLPELDFSSIF